MHLTIAASNENPVTPVTVAENRISQLRDKINERVNADSLLDILDNLIANFSTYDTDEGTVSQKRIAGYMLACENLPSWAIRQAAKDFLQASVSWHNPAYMPKPAELAKRAKQVMEPTREELYQAYQKLKLEKERAARAAAEVKKPQTEEEWERRRQQVDRLLRQTRGVGSEEAAQ